MSKKIEQLTPEQEKKVQEYYEEFRLLGLSTTPCDRAEAERAITDSYLYLKMAPPKFTWVDSPFAGAKMAAQFLKGDTDVTTEEIRDMADKAFYGSFDSYWAGFYCFIAEQLPVDPDPLPEITRRIVTHCGVYWVFKGMVVISEKPVAIHLKDGVIHNEDGLAIEYKDGTGLCAINGELKSSLMDTILQGIVGTTEEKNKENK